MLSGGRVGGVTLHLGVRFPPTADIHYSVPAARVNIYIEVHLGMDHCVNMVYILGVSTCELW